MAGRLCDALAQIYTPEPWRVARSLAVLSRLADRPEDAKRYQHLADFSGPADILRWRAQVLLESVTDSWDEWESARAAEVLLDAVTQLFRLVPMSEEKEYARQAYALACRAKRGKLQLDALHAESQIDFESNDLDASAEHAEAALRIARALPDMKGQAEALLTIGATASRKAETLGAAAAVTDFEQAETTLDSAARAFRKLGERVSEAHTRKALGYAHYWHFIRFGGWHTPSAQLELEECQMQFEAALEILRGLQEENALTANEVAAIVELLVYFGQINAAGGHWETASEQYSDAVGLP